MPRDSALQQSALWGSANRVTALVIGVGYLALGAIGFTITTAFGFVHPVGALLFGVVALNSLQNVVHLVIGAALVAAAIAGRTAARLATRLVGTLVLLLGIAGLFISSTEFNLLGVNAAANLIHFATAATLLAVGLGTDRTPTPR